MGQASSLTHEFDLPLPIAPGFVIRSCSMRGRAASFRANGGAIFHQPAI